MIRLPRLGRSGAAAAEFALTVPLVLVLTIGFVNMGITFWANAGLQNGLGEAARLATLWPTRSNAEIQARLNSSMFGVDPGKLAAPTFVRGTSGGQNYVDIGIAYQADIDMIIFQIPVGTIRHSRRAYTP